MAVTYHGLRELEIADGRMLTAFVYAMPATAGVAVMSLLFLVAIRERRRDAVLRNGQCRGRSLAARDAHFVRAYRIGRRANAVGRNRNEAARIRPTAIDRTKGP